MSDDLEIVHFTPEQQALWKRVDELWVMCVRKDADGIRQALHPRYVGWETGSPIPHDRDYAVKSASSDPARIVSYDLRPMSVEVYEGRVGIAHYYYIAVLSSDGDQTRVVEGRWTEVYLKQDGTWLMIGVHGGPKQSD